MLAVKNGAFWLAWAVFFSTVPAFAYVDPGSGSVIVTTILGIIAAIGFTFRKWFYKLRKMFFGAKATKDDSDDE